MRQEVKSSKSSKSKASSDFFCWSEGFGTMELPGRFVLSHILGLCDIPCKTLCPNLCSVTNAEYLDMCQVYADRKVIECQWRLDIAIVAANMHTNFRIALLG